MVEQNRQYPGFRHAVLLTLMVFLFSVVVSIPLSMVGLAFGLNIGQHPVFVGLVNLVSFGVILSWGLKKTQTPPAEILPFTPVRGALLLPMLMTMLGLCILLSEVDNLFRRAFPPPGWLLEFFKNLTSAETVPWESFIVLVIVAPLTEELFFRGLILHGFLSRYSVPTSVLVSAVLFGLLHGNPWQFFSATFLGIVFGWWFLRTRSLLPCLVGHSCNNSFVLFNSLLPFKIRGFNLVEPSAEVQFQPLWFDLAGLTLLTVGIWLFQRLTRNRQLGA